METKESIRKTIFRLRREMPDADCAALSGRIEERLADSEVYRNADWIYAYMDMRHEVMTRRLLERAWADGKRTAVPRVEGEEIVFYVIDSFSQLKKGYFGIEEPEGVPVADAEDALLILPGVAFGRDMYRVGYGGGFYDRYLSRHSRHKTVALAFEFQIFDTVPREETDLPVEGIVTEAEWIG